jgi:hypothetical protein
MLHNVICDKHEEYCKEHKITYRVQDCRVEAAAAAASALAEDDTDDENSDKPVAQRPELNTILEIDDNEEVKRLLMTQGWRHVHSTQGLVNLIKKQKKSAPFPDGGVQKLTR